MVGIYNYSALVETKVVACEAIMQWVPNHTHIP